MESFGTNYPLGSGLLQLLAMITENCPIKEFKERNPILISIWC